MDGFQLIVFNCGEPRVQNFSSCYYSFRTKRQSNQRPRKIFVPRVSIGLRNLSYKLVLRRNKCLPQSIAVFFTFGMVSLRPTKLLIPPQTCRYQVASCILEKSFLCIVWQYFYLDVAFRMNLFLCSLGKYQEFYILIKDVVTTTSY